jgi:chromosome segregation ATPase
MTADGEPTSADNLKQKLAQHIDAARNKLEALKRDIVGMREEDMDALRKRRDELERRLEGQKERARKLQADITGWRQERVAHTKEAIGSWRKRRELDKLEARAERAEDYAVDLVTVAALDFEEAEQAVLDAVTARFEADHAS